MRHPFVFISAPFTAPTAVERAWNCDRARRLGLLALETGLTPFVPHLAVPWLLGGDDTHRGEAVALCLTQIRAMSADPLSQFWLLLRDDGTTSGRCMGERAEWGLGRTAPAVVNTWEGWGAEFKRLGRERAWQSLRVPPTPAEVTDGEYPWIRSDLSGARALFTRLPRHTLTYWPPGRYHHAGPTGYAATDIPLDHVAHFLGDVPMPTERDLAWLRGEVSDG